MYVYKIMCNNILVHSSALVLATCCAILVNHKYREFDLNFHQVYTLCHYNSNYLSLYHKMSVCSPNTLHNVIVYAREKNGVQYCSLI